MAEQESKPTNPESEQSPTAAHLKAHTYSRRLLPVGLGLIALLVGCFWWGNETPEFNESATVATVTAAPGSTQTRPPQSNAALTRVASSLAQSQQPLPSPTPSPITTSPVTTSPITTSPITTSPITTSPITTSPITIDSALVPLPTVTPTLIPSPLPTRTVELSGEATLRVNLNSDSFTSSGQPVTLPLEPRSYVLGADTMTQSDEWCTQVGATGLVFDLVYTLNPVNENLHVGGEMRLYDGFCGEWGSLGNVLASAPMNVNVPVGTTALYAPSLQFQGSFLGIPNVLNISTGVFLDLTIRNPGVR